MLSYQNHHAVLTWRFAQTLTITTLVMAMIATKAVSTADSTKTNINWGQCVDSNLIGAGAECGFLSVPLDHARPHNAMIQLAISRIKHTVPDSAYQGVLLVNVGGPGYPNLGSATLSQRLPANISGLYDWIGFDPRGLGSSKPALSCLPYYFAGPRPNYTPSNKGLENIWLTRSRSYARACAKNNSALLKHMTSLDVVKDIESIRIALQQKQINFYGFDYGTYLGQIYATLFPERVRRMIFDSSIDPRKIWFEENLEQSLGFERNTRLWFAWLAKYDSVYHLGDTECQVADQWNEVLQQLQSNPANGTIGPSEWLDVFLASAYQQSSWPSLGTVFSQWVHTKSYEQLVTLYTGTDSVGNDNGYAVYLAVQCTDKPWPQSFDYVRTENWRTFSKAPIFTWTNAWFNGPCQYWPQKGSIPVQVDGTKIGNILMIHQTLDADRPFDGSLAVRQLFPRARLIAEPNGTSTSSSLTGNRCVDDRIAEYLQSGHVPPRQPGSGPDILCAPPPEPVPTAA